MAEIARIAAARGEAEAEDYRLAPHNIEAEQQLLGALLVNNDAYDRVLGVLKPEQFYEPVHGRIYEAIARMITAGRAATPVSLKTQFERDEALSDAGGAGYLVKLAGGAVTAVNAADYARLIHDLAVRRELIQIGEETAAEAYDAPAEIDPQEQITAAEQALYTLAETGRHQSSFKSFAEALADSVKVAAAAYKRDGGLAGVATGFVDLDGKLGGLHPSDLIIVAARPGMGKSALAANIAFNAARAHRTEVDENGETQIVDGAVAGFFSLEMSSEQLATRILSEQSGIASENIRRGRITEAEYRRLVAAAAELERAPLFFDDTPAIPISTLAARARRLKRQHNLSLLIVDYLQLVRPAGGSRADGRVQEVSEITQGLKALAKELNLPVVALSQLSRQVENRDDKRPQLSDLRESGSIEQDADVVMFIFREEYYVARSEPREGTEEHLKWQSEMDAVHNIAEIIIGKQRHGPIGTVKLQFQSEFTRFGNLAAKDRGPGAEL